MTYKEAKAILIDKVKPCLNGTEWEMALDIAIKALEQEPKTGHWILDETDNSITCDKCGCLIWSNDISNGEANFCPNCGAKMVDPQESEG